MKRLMMAATAAFFMLAVTASSADTFAVRLVSQTSTTITLGWDPQPGYGYLFSADGTLVSRTNDPNRSTVKFSKQYSTYEVAVIVKGATGTYPPPAPPPPPPPTGTVSQTIVANSTLSGVVTWRAVYDANGDGIEDDPGAVNFYVDGALVLTEVDPPFGDTVGFWASTTVANGSHSFRVDAVNTSSVVIATSTVQANVDNTVTPPPPPPPPPPPGDANGWMGPNGNVRGNQSLPCLTWNRAYAVAQSGDTISVANGTYPGTGADLAGTKTITFQVAQGASASTGYLGMQGLSNVTFNGPIVITGSVANSWNLKAWSSSNLTFDRVKTPHFNISGSTNVTMTNGDVGGYTGLPFGGDSVINRGGNIVLDHMYFHDVQYTSNWGGGHPDCLESSGGFNGITIRNSRFERCGNTFIGFYTDEINGGEWHNVLVENNVFKYVWASVWGIQITNKKPTWPFDCTGIVFRYNTYQPLDPNHQNPDQDYPPPRLTCDDAAQVYGNIIYKDAGGCGSAWSYNVFPVGNACGTNTKVGDPAFVDKAAGDFHLSAGSIALGAGDPSRFPATDFEGTVRSSPPDAGYDER